MGTELLIRAYNVGCGDCFYVRIPGDKENADNNKAFHILIDCGKKGGTDLLKKAVADIEHNLLPPSDKPGKKRLDLIVATHRHEDHIKGFDPEWFSNIQVRNVWLSVAMDPKHPQAQRTRSLHALATQTMQSLIKGGSPLTPELEVLSSLYGVSNDAADDFLMKAIPKANGIMPAFVHSGMKGSDLGLKLPAQTEVHVLAPEQDIDGYYLGEELDTTLRGFEQSATVTGQQRAAAPSPQPINISARDFEKLQSRMLSSGLAFAAKDSSIQNNLSVVLLIEWKKRRLLFVGDAEWEGEYKEGKQNGSWNVMWEKHGKKLLASPVDFLKIGHHGSINATPPPASAARSLKPGDVYRILETILPAPSAGAKPTAKAIVSTEREFYNPIPECKLLVELARRVSNTRNYGDSLKDPGKIWVSEKAKKNKFYERYEKTFLHQPQPFRTDLEFQLSHAPYIDVKIKANGR